MDPSELEQEAVFLASTGIRELVLVAQDLTSYGVERGEKGRSDKAVGKAQERGGH